MYKKCARHLEKGNVVRAVVLVDAEVIGLRSDCGAKLCDQAVRIRSVLVVTAVPECMQTLLNLYSASASFSSSS
jgi:hypothetical protein